MKEITDAQLEKKYPFVIDLLKDFNTLSQPKTKYKHWGEVPRERLQTVVIGLLGSLAEHRADQDENVFWEIRRKNGGAEAKYTPSENEPNVNFIGFSLAVAASVYLDFCAKNGIEKPELGLMKERLIDTFVAEIKKT